MEHKSTQKDNLSRAVTFMLFFMKIGCFTFGGGWSILSQMDQEFIQKRHWITEEELLDITSVGKSLPGVMITNISTIFGYQMCGVIGARACTVGIAIPSIVILTLVTIFYTILKDNLYVSYLMMGVRSAVVPIILMAVLRMWKSAIKDRCCLIFVALACLLSIFTPVGNIQIMLLGIASALVIMLWKKNSEKKYNGQKPDKKGGSHK